MYGRFCSCQLDGRSSAPWRRAVPPETVGGREERLVDAGLLALELEHATPRFAFVRLDVVRHSGTRVGSQGEPRFGFVGLLPCSTLFRLVFRAGGMLVTLFVTWLRALSAG